MPTKECCWLFHLPEACANFLGLYFLVLTSLTPTKLQHRNEMDAKDEFTSLELALLLREFIFCC